MCWRLLLQEGYVCCVLTLYNQNSYSELSILSLFILSQDALAYVHLLLLYFDLLQIRCFYYILFEIIAELLFFSHISNIFLFENSKHNFYLQTNESRTFESSIINNLLWPLKDGPYRGLFDIGEGDHESDINILASVNLMPYKTVTNHC